MTGGATTAGGVGATGSAAQAEMVTTATTKPNRFMKPYGSYSAGFSNGS